MLFHRILQNVVVTGDICRDQRSRSSAGGYCHEPCRVEPVAIFPHGCSNPDSPVVPFNCPFFVADTPQDDARVIAVALYHPLQQPDMFPIDPHQPVLLNDQNTQTVAQVKNFRCHRIVARPVGIASELFQLHKPPFLEIVRDGRSYSCMVLMHVHAFELDTFTVEEKSPVRVEFHLADTCDGGI